MSRVIAVNVRALEPNLVTKRVLLTSIKYVGCRRIDKIAERRILLTSEVAYGWFYFIWIGSVNVCFIKWTPLVCLGLNGN